MQLKINLKLFSLFSVAFLATDFNGQLPIGYLPLQPSTGNKEPSTTKSVESSSQTPVSTEGRVTPKSTTSLITSSPVKPSTTEKQTTTNSRTITPTTTKRKITTSSAAPPKKTTDSTKRTTEKPSFLGKKFPTKRRKPFTTRPTAPPPKYHSYVQYPNTVPLKGFLEDNYEQVVEGVLHKPSHHGIVLGGFHPILQKQKYTKAHPTDKQIPPTTIVTHTISTTTPTTLFQNRSFPTYKPQPDLVVAHTTISSTTTPLYDPFQFQIEENKNSPKPSSGSNTKINPSKKLAFLKEVEKLRKTSSQATHVDQQIGFNRNRRTTGKPLSGVNVTPRSFPKTTNVVKQLPKRRNSDFINLKKSAPKSRATQLNQELARAPKSASSISIKKKNISTADEARRNMLMNIILRPGGGDKSKALPRPKVDVYSEGPNVIVVRMTFPENENIQGLRAYTPDPETELEKLTDIEKILPENASIERISAISSEELVDDNDISDGIPEDVVQSISNAVKKNSQLKFAQLNHREKLTEHSPPNTFQAPSTNEYNEFREYDFDDVEDDNGGSAQEEFDGEFEFKDDNTIPGSDPLYYDLTSDYELPNQKQHIRRQRQPQNINIQKFVPTDATKNIHFKNPNQLPSDTLERGYYKNDQLTPSIPPPPKPPTRPTRPPKKIPNVSYPSTSPSKPSFSFQRNIPNAQTHEHPKSYQPYLSTLTPTEYNQSIRDRQRYGIKTHIPKSKWVSPYTRVSTNNGYHFRSADSDSSKYFPRSRNDAIPTTVTSWQGGVRTTPFRGLLQKFFPFSSERLS